MPLPLKEQVKLNQIIDRIESGNFDANDIDNLLMKVRPYAEKDTTLLEVSNFVAHSDARDRGLAQRSITSFVDSMQFFQEYGSGERRLVLDKPFSGYIYRLFLSQAHLVDELRLKADHRLSRATLLKKIESNFVPDKKSGTCCLKKGKGGIELLAALRFVTGFIHARAAFHIADFHKELKQVMNAQRIRFNPQLWDAQADRVSLAVLCLVSNTEFLLPNGERANCRLGTEHDFRLLSGERRLPTGVMSAEPTSFGKLSIWGKATVISENNPPLEVGFPLISTDLDPHEHCDPGLFSHGPAPADFGQCMVEVIEFAQNMSLSADFKLIRTDSLI